MPRPKLKTVGNARAPQSAAAEAVREDGKFSDASTVLARSSPVPWWIAFGFLVTLTIVLLWAPLSRITAHLEINYNEGWNSYLQRAAASGARIYGQAPLHVYANYPPVSFHLVGFLGRFTHDMTATGRWVSLLSFFALAVLSGLTVHRLTGSPRSGAFSALSVAILLTALKQDRIGMNDPHLLGMAFIAFGLYAYVRDPESRLWLRLSAVACVLGLFTKQTLIAFPLAIGIQLLLTSRKRLLSWLGAGTVVAVALFVFTVVVDGSHFLEHLLLPRVYSYSEFLANTLWYLLMFQTAMVVGMVWCFQNHLRNRTSVLMWAFVTAHLLAFWFSAGDGADLNHLFDPLVAIALIAGVALPQAVRASEKVSSIRSPLLVVLLIMPLYLGVLVMLTTHIQEDIATNRAIPELEQDFASVVQFVSSHPGPAFCEDPLVCYEAGKPLEFDPFAVSQEIKTGKVSESSILRLFDEHHFSSVELFIRRDEPVTAGPRARFSQAFMTHLLNHYGIAARTGTYTLLTPNL